MSTQRGVRWNQSPWGFCQVSIVVSENGAEKGIQVQRPCLIVDWGAVHFEIHCQIYGNRLHFMLPPGSEAFPSPYQTTPKAQKESSAIGVVWRRNRGEAMSS